MQSRQELARVALRAALEIRKKCVGSYDAPICPYDVAEKLGLEVWFLDGASFGGMFVKGQQRLFIPAERPPGRKAFTCGHEMAHWRFDHGTRVDELDFDRSDSTNPEEIIANLFSGYLLMPRRAVESEFGRRSLDPNKCSPIDIYLVASQLGVGYETLLKHLHWSLNLIDHSRMTDFCLIPPKDIRRTVIGSRCPGHLVLADQLWHKVAIDLEIGDVAVVPKECTQTGLSVRCIGECEYGKMFQAVHTGLAQLLANQQDWAAMVRVSRKHYVGRGAYRHLEDPDENT
jgi:hypothetical protein